MFFLNILRGLGWGLIYFYFLGFVALIVYTAVKYCVAVLGDCPIHVETLPFLISFRFSGFEHFSQLSSVKEGRWEKAPCMSLLVVWRRATVTKGLHYDVISILPPPDNQINQHI